jgi:hypothetical protein
MPDPDDIPLTEVTWRLSYYAPPKPKTLGFQTRDSPEAHPEAQRRLREMGVGDDR